MAHHAESQSGTNSCNSIFNVFAFCVFVSPIVFYYLAYSFTCGSKLSRIYVCHEDFISSFIITHHKHHYVYMSEFHCFNASLFIILSSLFYLHLTLSLTSRSLSHLVQMFLSLKFSHTTTGKKGIKVDTKHTLTQIVLP